MFKVVTTCVSAQCFSQVTATDMLVEMHAAHISAINYATQSYECKM